jgi:glycerophosphoryl diester phosphodiesterase
MTREALDWLKRPIAHRGLHDEASGIVENSASAVEAAIAKGYAVEVDLQCAAHGAPIVFHDRTLDRLTAERGPVADRDADALCAIALRNSKDRILSLDRLLGIVNGRVPLLIEVKSTWSDNHAYERNIAEALRAYEGNVAVMSFDPECLAAFRREAPALPRGLIAERFEDQRYWSDLSARRRFAMRHLLTAAIAQPNFIAYDIKALPALAPGIARDVFHLPLLTWTVRSEADKANARLFADAMIFEGVTP